ncbi:MAG: RidA family protein [Porphyromonas sp.]|nr:RidA family protein [Porphyromonas sp.]
MKKEIKSDLAPAAIGPYSQAIVANGLCFVSGQLGIDPATGKMVSDKVEEQAEQVFKNIKVILKEAGLQLDDAVKVTVFLSDMGDFAKVNEVYAKHFSAPYPARCAYAVKGLPANGLVEIDVIAAL